MMFTISGIPGVDEIMPIEAPKHKPIIIMPIPLDDAAKSIIHETELKCTVPATFGR
jgi:hypothetical protein